ncbi:MAG: biotin/lipoyl-containing protein, partial [Paraperlucidibaca sp.]
MTTSVRVPDLGVDAAEVIELLVKPGDTVKKEQPIAVLESDKASLELPAP